MAHPQRHARGQRYKHGLVSRSRSPSVRRAASPSRSRSPSPLGRRHAKAEAKAHAQAAEKRIAELDLELKNVEEQRARLSTITMDEYFETNPELKKEIDEKIKNDKWFEV